jgi:hypothetical protein
MIAKPGNHRSKEQNGGYQLLKYTADEWKENIDQRVLSLS